MQEENTRTPLTVTALTNYIDHKFTKDPYMQDVLLIGEISNYKPRSNHQYFNLKDENSQIRAVMFAGFYNKLKFKFKDGDRVIVKGRVTVYKQGGNYQIQVTDMQPDGVGALHLAFEQLKEKLEKAGWFDQPKKPLPKYPKKIAVITSPTADALRDIRSTIKRRYPILEITVFPTLVQGEKAAANIVQAFKLLEQHADDYDLVILARGGGSIEDLWCFNEEIVAKAVLDCSIPVVTGVGHEPDWTIVDFVADHRAPTPTGAAEYVTPVLAEELSNIKQASHRLYTAMSNRINHLRNIYERFGKAQVFTQPSRLYDGYQQQLDHLTSRLYNRSELILKQARASFDSSKQRLLHRSPKPRIEQEKVRLENLKSHLELLSKQNLTNKRRDFEKNLGLLHAVSPLANFQRGYSVVEDSNKKLISSIKDIKEGDTLSVYLQDGKVVAKAQEVTKEKLIDIEE